MPITLENIHRLSMVLGLCNDVFLVLAKMEVMSPYEILPYKHAMLDKISRPTAPPEPLDTSP